MVFPAAQKRLRKSKCDDPGPLTPKILGDHRLFDLLSSPSLYNLPQLIMSHQSLIEVHSLDAGQLDLIRYLSKHLHKPVLTNLKFLHLHSLRPINHVSKRHFIRSALQQLKNLTTLRLEFSTAYGRRQSKNEFSYLISSTDNLRNLVNLELVFHSRDVTSGELTHLLRLIRHFRAVKSLRFQFICGLKLSNSSIERISRTMSCLPDLTEFELTVPSESSSKAEIEDFSSVFVHLTKCKKLKVLRLELGNWGQNTHLPNDGLNMFTDYLKTCCVHFEELELTFVVSEGFSLAQLMEFILREESVLRSLNRFKVRLKLRGNSHEELAECLVQEFDAALRSQFKYLWISRKHRFWPTIKLEAKERINNSVNNNVQVVCE